MLSADKYSGGLVGWRGGPASTTAAQDASVEETLVASDGVSVLSSVVAEDGRIAWLKTTHADEAYRKTVAMSQMASMLKDRARNEAYAAAITKCVAQFSAEHGRPPVVLDVGAGTGLLSLLSARAGAAAVHGVEQWAVMAGIAQQVVACNAPLDAAVRIHATHSSALAVAPAPSLAPAVRKLGGAAPMRSSPLAPKPAASAGASAAAATAQAAAAACGDAYTIPAHADVVVSEILDSALLGEGVIPSLSHAFAELMRAAQAPQTAGAGSSADAADGGAAAAHGASGTPPCVPLSATVYAQLVHSPQFGAWQDTTDTSIPVPAPPAASTDAAAATAPSEAAHGAGASPHRDSDAAAACAPLLLSRRDWQPTCNAQPVAVPIHVRLLTPAPVAVSPVFTACEILFTPEGVRAVSQPHGEGSAAATAAPAARADGGPAGPSPQRQILTVPALAEEPSAGGRAPTANALLFWWRAVLWRGSAGASSDVVYCTCAGCVEAQGWQDHWVQCVLPLARPVAASAGVAGAQQHADIPLRTAAPCFAPAAGSVSVGAAGGAAEAYPVGLCPSAMAATAADASAASVEPAAPSSSGFSFTVAVDLSPMAVQFQVGPGDAEVWPAKRLRNRAVKEGRAVKLAPGAPLMCVDEPEPCTCGLHSLYSVDRRWALNDPQRWGAFTAGLQQALQAAVSAAVPAAGNSPFTVISLGDGAVAGLAVAAALEEAGTEFGLPARATGDASDKAEADAAEDAGDGTHESDGDEEKADKEEEAEGAPSTFRVLAVEDSRLAAVHTEALARARGLPEDAFSAIVAPALEGSPASTAPPAAAAAAGAGAEQAAPPAADGDHGLAALLEAHAAAADSSSEVSGGPFAHLLVLEPVFARMQTHPLWCAVSAWRRCAALAPLLHPSAVVFPGRARVCAQAVWFAHLADNHGTVGSVCGFDHSPFDAVEAGWHRHTYTYPLHQYGWAPASAPATEWAPLSFAAPARDAAGGGKEAGDLAFSTTLTLRTDVASVESAAAGAPPCAHGVMFWVEYDAQSACAPAAEADSALHAASTAASPVLTTHPTAAPHQRQHVRFFERPVPLAGGAGPASVSVRLHIARVAGGGVEASSGGAWAFDLDAQLVA